MIATGIPTTYLGRTYRSRLEARWAAFFDLAGWRYEYEPYDLNGWIPDFVLFGKEEWAHDHGQEKPAHLGITEILVEVKPYSSLEEFDTAKIEQAIAGTEKQGLEVLLLGMTIWEDRNPYIGWLGDWWQEQGYDFAAAPFHGGEDGLGFCHGDNSFHNRITGEYEGGGWGDAKFPDLQILWNKAGNAVQWKGTS